jgi:hypothetical protein
MLLSYGGGALAPARIEATRAALVKIRSEVGAECFQAAIASMPANEMEAEDRLLDDLCVAAAKVCELAAPSELCQPTRRARVVEARGLVLRAIEQRLVKMPWAQIAKRFGRSQSGLRSLHGAVRVWMECDAPFRARAAAMDAMLEGAAQVTAGGDRAA